MDAEPAAPRSLPELLADLADQLDDVVEAAEGESTEYRRDATLFAVAAPAHVEVRLNPEVAEAARRTPATSASERGPEWVVFAPPAVDEHALDRAEAWFLSAWRAADTSRRT